MRNCENSRKRNASSSCSAGISPAGHDRKIEIFPSKMPASRGRDISRRVVAAMEAHAMTQRDGEVCGFVYRNHYVPLRNTSASNDRFFADPPELARVLSQYGEPVAIFHTHPTGNLSLSSEDTSMWYYSNSTMIVGCVENGHLRWKIYGNRGN